MLEMILKSNLLGVVIGGFITLLSIYSVELFKSWKEIRTNRRKIYYQIVAHLNMFQRFVVLAAQMDLLFNYHKCQKKLNLNENQREDAQYHKKEAQRRLLQFEEFQSKRIEIEMNLFSEVAKYVMYVGKDTYLDGLINKIEDWEPPEFSSDFELLNNVEECKSVYNECDKKINSIDQNMKKLKEDCLLRISDKLRF